MYPQTDFLAANAPEQAAAMPPEIPEIAEFTNLAYGGDEIEEFANALDFDGQPRERPVAAELGENDVGSDDIEEFANALDFDGQPRDVVRTAVPSAPGSAPQRWLPAKPQRFGGGPASPKGAAPPKAPARIDKSGATAGLAPNGPASSTKDERATMKGQVIAKSNDGGLILKSTSKNSASGSSELIHLPASAVAQLTADTRSRKTIENSLQKGDDAAPIEISNFKGKWSARDTSRDQIRQKNIHALS